MPDFVNSAQQRSIGTELVVVAVALISIGVVMVTSAGASVDRSIVDCLLHGSALQRQLLFAVAGIAALRVGPRLIAPILASQRPRSIATKIFFIAVMVGLIAAWIPSLADVHRGSHRWLKVGVGAWSFSVQPSEFAKVAMVLFVAVLLTRPGVELRDFRRGFVPPMIAGAACAGLVGLADFGTAVLLASVVGIMLLVGGCRMLHLAILTLGGCIGLGVLLLAEPYRLERVDSFLRMWQDPQGVGYQPVQSLVTIASGGWMGAGLGAGVQKYGYLPESHTDFIFAILCEETGVLGGAFVMALFGALVLLGWRTVRSAATPFERLVALGLTSVIGLQAVMNIAVVTVVVPTKGMSLPLISAGGSGLLACCLAITILVAIAARAGAVAHTQAFHAVHPKNQNEERAHGRDPAVGYAAGQPSW